MFFFRSFAEIQLDRKQKSKTRENCLEVEKKIGIQKKGIGSEVDSVKSRYETLADFLRGLWKRGWIQKW